VPAVAGILTDRDFVRARLGHYAALSTIRVTGVMRRNPLFDESETLANAVRALRARAARRFSDATGASSDCSAATICWPSSPPGSRPWRRSSPVKTGAGSTERAGDRTP